VIASALAGVRSGCSTLPHGVGRKDWPRLAQANQLDIAPQVTLRLFARLEQVELVREVTGRESFRAFALFVWPTVPLSPTGPAPTSKLIPDNLNYRIIRYWLL